MEYLMTYGWAILIIAVVLGAFFQLGVFSGIGTPRAQPGNCQVVKVGSGITQTISLAGECQGQEPEYVVESGGSGSFPITINLPSSSYLPSGTGAISIFAWVDISQSDTGSWQRVVSYGTSLCNGQNAALEINGAGVIGSVTYDSECGPSAWTSNLNTNNNQWQFIGLQLPRGGGSANVILYLNGMAYPLSGNNAGVASISPQEIIIGGGPGTGAIIGYISNVQIYNITLSASEITALYQEGIGGAPINPQYIVGWWPLNGNAQDYSGNNNNGRVTGITYSSSWTNGYTPP